MEKNNLSKSTILQQFTQTEIFLKFLNLSEVPKGNISSPFALDKVPSFRLYLKTNSFKCNSSGHQGDCFELVAQLNNLCSRYHFKKVLQIIQDTMIVNVISILTTQKLNENGSFNVNGNISVSFTVNVEKRLFTTLDLVFWTKIGVPKTLLERYKVTSVANYEFKSIVKQKAFSFKIASTKLCFAYQIGANSEVYLPEQTQHQQPKMFINGLSHSDIFGFEQLQGQWSENIVICAGKKDTLTMVSRGFPAVSFRSETHHPTNTQIEMLQKHCKNLLICYDVDKGGEIGSNAVVQRFPFVTKIDLPPNEHIKGFDVTDYFQQFDKSDFQKLIVNAAKK